jgi:hypothetical protein
MFLFYTEKGEGVYRIRKEARVFLLCLSVPIEGGISYRRGASSNLEGGAVLLLVGNLGGHCVPLVTSE